MKVKQLWVYFPLPAKLKLFWERLTLSRLTIWYFIFSIVHAIVQVSLQAKAFSFDIQAAMFLKNIVQQGNATANGFMVYNGDDLRLCDFVPNSISATSCEVIWDGTPANDTQYSMTGSANKATTVSSSPVLDVTSSSTFSSSISRVSSSLPVSEPRSVSPTLTPSFSEFQLRTTTTTTVLVSTPSTTQTSSWPSVSDTSPLPIPTRVDVGNGFDEPTEFDKRNDQPMNTSGEITVKIYALGLTNNEVVVDKTCLWVLNWPITTLEDNKREDAVFTAFQIWVLGMSVVALLNESIPHVLASLLTHMLAIGWSGFQISNINTFSKKFAHLTTQGACKPLDLLPTFWKPRINVQIVGLVLNIVALVAATFLSWRLMKAFGWRTFKRIGASVQINRQYTVVLILAITIQLDLFFVLVSIGLWIDQLYNGSIGRLATRAAVYKAVLILVLVLLIPWLTLGWFSSRRELKIPMWIFLGLSCGYLVGWGAMFASTTFHWTFVEWGFFSAIVCSSLFLTIATLFCGGICLLGFGKGLPRYLNTQQPILGPDFETFNPSDVEKIDFPPAHQPIRTFSVAFGSGEEVPPSTHSQPMGSRLLTSSSEPIESQTVLRPLTAHLRLPSYLSNHSEVRLLARSGSIVSLNSHISSAEHGSSSTIESYSRSGHSDTRLVRSDG